MTEATTKTTGGLSKKGLGAGTVGLVGATVIGVSCIAPAYTLTASLGPTVTAVKEHVPAVFIVGFIPMLLVAFGYRELNSRMPDSGTSFTWATRAFGPWVGWMAGWGLIMATIIVLSNLAAVAVDFFYLALSQILRNPSIADLTDNKPLNIATCLAFIAITTFISYRDMQTSQKVQYFLVGFQILIMIIFGGVALSKAYSGDGLDHLAISGSWFNPFEIDSFSALSEGLAYSIFAFWGWDVCLTMTEETRGSRRTPGRAAMLTVATVMSVYLWVSMGLMSFAGIGDTGNGLGNPTIAENVFFHLAGPVLGGAGILVSVAVLTSSAASLQSTVVSPARTMLAMGHYNAWNKSFTRIHPRFFTPGYATITCAIVTSTFYTIMRIVSEDVLWDTVAALSAMVCFYYGITALSAVWYFRKEWFTSVRNVFYTFLFPLIGGLALTAIFVQMIRDSMDPSFGSGENIGGIGLVFIITVGIIVLGMVLMFTQATRRKDFFRGAVIPRGRAGDAHETEATFAE